MMRALGVVVALATFLALAGFAFMWEQGAEQMRLERIAAHNAEAF